MTDFNPELIEKALREFTKPRVYTNMSLDGTRAKLTAALSAVADDLRAEGAAQALRDALARLGRAAYAVDSTHHFHGIQCSCGFTGDARKRTQTEHITTAVLEAYDHD